jgi:hypothetical protein
MPRGHKPGTTPGPCDTCGRAKVWKADSRRATGGYWTCSHGRTAAPRTPRAEPGRRVARPPTPAARRRSRIGTQDWLTDPAVAACKADDCFWDAHTCPEHRKR